MPSPGNLNLRVIELGPTGRDALNHLFGVVRPSERRHEKEIRKTPPFTLATVDNGFAVMAWVGVVLKVVASTGRSLDKLLHCFPLTPTRPTSGLEPTAIGHTIAA